MNKVDLRALVDHPQVRQAQNFVTKNDANKKAEEAFNTGIWCGIFIGALCMGIFIFVVTI